MGMLDLALQFSNAQAITATAQSTNFYDQLTGQSLTTTFTSSPTGVIWSVNETYFQQLGEAARKRLSPEDWNLRVKRAVETLDALFFFDHVYIGGGNSSRVTVDLGPKASIVDNSAGILGGIRLWDQDV